MQTKDILYLGSQRVSSSTALTPGGDWESLFDLNIFGLLKESTVLREKHMDNTLSI